jgi:hypothetical protein
MAILGGQPAFADTVPAVYVTAVDADDAGMAACGLTYSAATATAQAALRYNRVVLASREQYFADKAINLAIGINAFEIRRGGEGTGTCAVNLDVTLGTFTRTIDPVYKNIKWATVQYCNKSSLFTVSRFGAQGNIDQSITQFTNECISKYEQLKTE